LPFWHQKNDLCYNSRLTREDIQDIVYDYCYGVSAKQSSNNFLKEHGKNVSRQTISKYFMRLSECVRLTRNTYPWWSVDNWYEISDEQIDRVRLAVYNDDNALKDIRLDFVETTGRTKSVDIDTYIKVLRDLSKTMNGLSKKHFWVQFWRACEIAYYIDAGHSDPAFEMYSNLLDKLEYGGYQLLNRKASPTTHAEAGIRKKTKDKNFHTWADFGKGEYDTEEQEWWNGLSESERTKVIKKARLSIFDPDIELDHKDTIWRVE